MKYPFVKPCSSMCKVESQLEAPFSTATNKALSAVTDIVLDISLAIFRSRCLLRLRALLLSLNWVALTSGVQLDTCCRMSSERGAAIFVEAK